MEIAAAAGGLLRAGIDARHLRAWRTSVEREVGLYEQLVMPLLRQRNPQARGLAVAQLERAQRPRGQAPQRPAARHRPRAARLVDLHGPDTPRELYARSRGPAGGRRCSGGDPGQHPDGAAARGHRPAPPDADLHRHPGGDVDPLRPRRGRRPAPADPRPVRADAEGARRVARADRRHRDARPHLLRRAAPAPARRRA